MFRFFNRQKSEETKREALETVWIQGFSQGFEKAWDMMVPLMSSGIEKSKKQIRTTAIEETLKRLNNGNKVPKE